MLQHVLYPIINSIIAYLILLVTVRVMGRKAISQMTFFDLAVVMALGSITADLALGPADTYISTAVTLISFGLLAVLTAYLHIKSSWLRKITNSEPVTAIENGSIKNNNLKKIRLTINELNSLLRQKNIFNFADVEFAIIESDGQISVLPKSQKSPLTPSDLNIPTSYKGLTRDLVMDGNLLQENLYSIKLDENWLLEQLAKQGIQKVEQVFYAGLDSEGGLYVSLKQPDRKERPGEHGIE